jgi:hypothetical protein
MYHNQVKEILNERLSNIILDKVTDSNWDKVIIYLGTVKVWDTLSEPCQLKAISFIDKLEIFDNSLKHNPISPKNVNVLLKAARLGFLKETVNNKLQLSLGEILSLKELCEDELKDNPINDIIKPLLEEKIPQANLGELFSMYSKEDSLLNEKIKPYLEEKIEESSLEKLIWSLERNLEENKFLDELIEPSIQAKINEASLDELLEARQFVSWFHRKYKKTFEDVIQTALRENVQHIVDRFRKSSSFRVAEANASLLADVFDYLSATQWEAILEEFCDNDQIYDSFRCPSIFSHLFEKSVKNNGSVQPYWLSFREKLNQFNSNYTSINELKSLIDSYCKVEF